MKILRYNTVCENECLFYKLLRLLNEYGWYNLGLGAWIKSRRIRDNGFQEVALRVLVWSGVVGEASRIKGGIDQVLNYQGREYRFVFGPGDVKADAAYYQHRCKSSYCIEHDDIVSLLPEKPKPLIVIDLAQLHMHNLDEASSLRRQLAATLGVIRRFLWDRHLLLTNAAEGVRAWLKSFMATMQVQMSSLNTDDALDVRGYTGLRILLDPNADKDLQPDEVVKADVFILGGIVDKRPRPGATRELPIEGAVRRRISLRGSIIGVPHTINTLVEALLLARYVYDGNIERALYDVTPPHEARIRAYVEISRVIRGAKGAYVDWDLYEELVKWLPLRPRDFEKAARMAGARLRRSYEEYLLSKDQSHH
ncbi:tRNA (guanine-N1-)-methyltransferase [Pyrolobus fumarii 1A]|uniref:tRNA (Guanine-N1-)-methyltransferase n=1 Tax=Pyrolobus fumarii (strain DSM 11204 / 1A) TaxID=694429 RepID=G0EEH7_PYRF1|nr:tRNA (guanine-N1-)-methyltransferase [Pyrolobus fumarii]AEM38018.1 tRNA (guanine-N1-)-methyltransferase [Pyrolobus fumarii 1A]